MIDSPARRSVYAVLIAASVGLMMARVARVDSIDPKSPTPFLSANDRSRWATIRALADDGTYVLDKIILDEQGRRVRGWHTIDLVRHPGPDGEQHYYSSKPTLLTTLLAGEYWLIKQCTGATLAEQPHYVARLMLILTNVLPLGAALWFVARMIERLGLTLWGRLYVVAAASFATFLTTFASTLNNHTVAATCLALGLAFVMPIFRDISYSWWRFVAGGFCFGLLAANELPAMSLLVLVGLALAWQSPPRTLIAFLPAVLLIAAAAIGTNLLAHGDWRTPYAHRSPGDNWYDYPGSYWLPDSVQGIDRGEPSVVVYALNCLIGHHGFFSLTPIWLLSLAGCLLWLARARSSSAALDDDSRSATRTHLLLAGITLIATALVFGFYITRGQMDRNYGGVTCCLRWLMWLTPLWLMTLVPAADWLSQSFWGRALALTLLVVSVFSAWYAVDNPWSHPWIFDYWTSMGWIDYG